MGQQARLVFDHEVDSSRPRRPVADWGGDEVFARTPRKRFKPVVVGAEATHAAPRPHVAEPIRPRLQAVPAPNPAPAEGLAADAPLERAGADQAAADPQWTALEHPGTDHSAPDPKWAAAERPAAASSGADHWGAARLPGSGYSEAGAERTETERAERERTRADEERVRADEERAPNGRRTVLITGRPGAHPAPRGDASTPARRRPPRTVEERLSARPDRVAAWACGLGVTLILAAVATADAAPL